MNKIINNKQGFSLIEVLLAMAILAVVSVPLLTNFATSAKINVSSAQLQDANVIGQSTIEEMKSMSLEEIHKKYTEDTSDALIAYDSSNNIDNGPFTQRDSYQYHQGDIAGEGGNYKVVTRIDSSPYNSPLEDPPGTILVKRNTFAEPNIYDINTENNVVISENDAITKFQIASLWDIHYNACVNYNTLHPGSPKAILTVAELEKELTREIHFKILDPDPLDDRVSVITSYVYYYNVNSFHDIAYGLDKTMKKSEEVYNNVKKSLQNIYLFYHPITEFAKQDNIIIEIDPTFDDTNKINMYVVAQGTSPDASYSIHFPNAIPRNPVGIEKIYLNVDKSFAVGSDDVFNTNTDLVSKSPDVKRLFDIEVKVYKSDANKPIVTFKSTKGD